MDMENTTLRFTSCNDSIMSIHHLSSLPSAKILPTYIAKVKMTVKFKVTFIDYYLYGALGR